MEDLPINLQQEGYGLATPSDPSEPRYPVLHYCGDEDLDLPQDGTMTVKFHVKRETSEVDRKTGKHSYDCDIEILSIEKVKGEDVQAPASSGNDAEDALDKIREEMEHDSEYGKN
jgi:hypothetical protein